MKTVTMMVAILMLNTTARAQTFVNLGIPAGQPRSRAVDLSNDGTTVVGDSSPNDQSGGQAWRWRSGSGFESLGTGLAAVTRTNNDGNAIVGYGMIGPAFYWRPGQPTIVPGTSGSNPQPGPGISGDGITVIGNIAGGSGGVYRASKWTLAGSTVQLPYAPSTANIIVPNGGFSFAFAVNHDASVIAGGMGFHYPTDPILFERVGVARWTSSGGQLLLTTSGLPLEGNVYDMSSDGNTMLVLGNSSATAFYRWTPGGGYQTVQGLQPFINNAVPRISGDGSTIISYDKMWTQGRGALPITQVLTEAGANYSGWTNLVVTGIDNNASHLCGYGTNPTGATEAWYATIPAPGVGVITALTGVVSCRRRR